MERQWPQRDERGLRWQYIALTCRQGRYTEVTVLIN
jgi:hypothetical protein